MKTDLKTTGFDRSDGTGRRRLMFVLTAFACLAFVLSTQLARAAESHVRDNASFFSADAVAEAEARLEALSRDNKKNVVVETLPEAPAEVRDRLNGADANTRSSVLGNYVE